MSMGWVKRCCIGRELRTTKLENWARSDVGECRWLVGGGAASGAGVRRGEFFAHLLHLYMVTLLHTLNSSTPFILSIPISSMSKTLPSNSLIHVRLSFLFFLESPTSMSGVSFLAHQNSMLPLSTKGLTSLDFFFVKGIAWGFLRVESWWIALETRAEDWLAFTIRADFTPSLSWGWRLSIARLERAFRGFLMASIVLRIRTGTEGGGEMKKDGGMLQQGKLG